MSEIPPTYFSSEEGGTPQGPARWVDLDRVTPASFAPGLAFRPILAGRSMVNFVYFDERAEAPVHRHAEEQVTVVLEGELEFTLDGETRVLRPGQAAVIPPWVPHGGRTTGTKCLEVDVFTPPRAALLAGWAEREQGEVAGG